MEFIEQIFPQLSQMEIIFHIAIFVGNITLFLLARPVLRLIDPLNANETKVRIFQALNILVFLLHFTDLVLIGVTGDYEHYFIKIGYSIMLIYGFLLFYSFVSVHSRRRFGKERNLDNNKIFVETYSSRMVNLVILVFLVVTGVYWLIIIWDAEKLFTGVYGILAAFLAFTSGIWAPDIVSGLIVLNTEILEDGDVVVIDGHKNEYIIGRVTLIYVVLYDVRNNHRTLMRNSQFTQCRIDNLSRVTSTAGIRRAMVYNIGYPGFTGEHTDRIQQLAEFKSRISDMFNRANTTCIEDPDIMVNKNKPFEWALTNAGDFALEYTLWIYLERIPSTKITSTIRRHLMGTIYKINEAVYDASIAEKIDLSTPNLQQVILPASEEPSKETPKPSITA